MPVAPPARRQGLLALETHLNVQVIGRRVPVDHARRFVQGTWSFNPGPTEVVENRCHEEKAPHLEHLVPEGVSAREREQATNYLIYAISSEAMEVKTPLVVPVHQSGIRGVVASLAS